MNNRDHSSAIELLQSTDRLLKQLPDPCISKESPQKGLIRLTFGGHHSGTKIAEEETGSIPHCSTATTGVPQTSRAWSGPQQSYSRGARLLEGKLSNRYFIINNLGINSETQSKSQQLLRQQVNKPTKMGRNQH